MHKRKFGWTGRDVPMVGQGTWRIEGGDNRRAIEALQLGLDLGLSHIDTAEFYGEGKVEEEIVAKVIEGRREEVFLVSKVWPSNASYDGTLKACKRSLKRLKTEWLDLYLLHWPSDQHPIKETMRAMEKLVDDGLIRFMGVSNFSLTQLKQAEKALPKYRIACNQVPYNLDNRQIEQRLLPYCIERQIAVVGYSPFGHGRFPSPKSRKNYFLEEIARSHSCTPLQVVLNFLTRLPNTFAIPKAGNPQHVRENSGGFGWNLVEEEVAAIDQIFSV